MGSSQRSRGIRRVVSLNLTQPAGGMAAAVHALACAQPWARRSTGQALTVYSRHGRQAQLLTFSSFYSTLGVAGRRGGGSCQA